MTLRKQEDTGSWRRKLKIALYGELSLEEAIVPPHILRDRPRPSASTSFPIQPLELSYGSIICEYECNELCSNSYTYQVFSHCFCFLLSWSWEKSWNRMHWCVSTSPSLYTGVSRCRKVSKINTNLADSSQPRIWRILKKKYTIAWITGTVTSPLFFVISRFSKHVILVRTDKIREMISTVQSRAFYISVS
jgi:hypothetical protein